MSYVLLGEFDIDEGSILKHQYPSLTGADEHLLAELMLPDGAHSRSEDWTIFYLNQTEAVTIKAEGEEGKLLYVLNLVRTKKDDKVRRGALVKALAICSPEPYVQIYKPLLLLALEDYFNNPSIDVLATLYNSVKAMDLSAMPRLTYAERLILRCSERKDLFEDRFPDLGASTGSDQTASSPSHSVEAMLPSPPASDGQDKRARRTASQSSRKGSITSFETASSGQLDRSTGSTSTWVRPRVPSGSDIGSARRPDMSTFGSQQSVVKQRLRDTHFFETKLTYNNIHLPIRVPVGIEDDEVGDYSLINLIQVFNAPGSNHTFAPPFHPHLHTSGALTPPIILLFNAMLTGKRIVFLGSSLPANQVAHLVLAACALGSGGGAGLLRGLTERCFPYSNLTNRGNHEAVPGYIAGVTNPRFEAFTNSYDVFCNIDTGRITVSKDIPTDANRATPPSSHSTQASEDPISPTSSSGNSVAPWEDQVRDPKFSNLSALAMAQTKELKDASDVIFMDEIHNLILGHAGETVIRAKFLQYLSRLIRIAAKYEEEVYGSTSLDWMSAGFSPAGLGSGTVLLYELGGKEVVSNAARIEGWRVTKSYQLFRLDAKDRLATSAFKSFDLHHQIARLRYSRNVPRAEVEAVFTTLAKSVKSDVQIIELLSLLPAHAGGLLPLAFGLFHPSQATRDATVELFLNIEAHPVGVKFIASLNTFHKLAFGRLARDRNEATPMLGAGRLA